MSTDEKATGVVEYCSFCKDYMYMFRLYLSGLFDGNYNSWQGMKSCIEDVAEKINSMDEEVLEAFAPICRVCENGPGVYAMSKRNWLELRESCREIEEELEAMSPEEIEDYLKEKFRKMFARAIIEELSDVINNLY